MILQQFKVGSKNTFSGLSFRKQKCIRVLPGQEDIIVIIALSSTNHCLSFLKFQS